MGKKIKIGIIGTGVGIRTHLKGFRLYSDKAEVYAISGSSYERSLEFAKQYNIPMACADYREICDNEEIDLICITTPNKYHYEMIKYAMSKKKNIICEKPMVESSIEAEEIANLAKDYPKMFVIDHQLRFNPYIIEIKRLIESGELGHVYNVKINQQGTGFANENAKWSWSFDGNQGGGVRLAMASHFTDLIQFWFGTREVVSISASMNPITKQRKDLTGNVCNITASTTCDAFIKLKDELTVHYSINAGSYMMSRFDIHIFGDNAEVIFSLQDKLLVYYRNNIGVGAQITTVNDVFEDELENKVSIFSGSFRYFAPLIIEAVQSNDYSKVDAATKPIETIYCAKILEAIKESANSSETIVYAKESNEYV